MRVAERAKAARNAKKQSGTANCRIDEHALQRSGSMVSKIFRVCNRKDHVYRARNQSIHPFV